MKSNQSFVKRKTFPEPDFEHLYKNLSIGTEVQPWTHRTRGRFPEIMTTSRFRISTKNICLAIVTSSVKVQLCFALIALHHAPKNLIAAFRTYIASFFVPNPFFSSELSSIRNRPQNDFLANCHRKVINVLAWKIIALMTTCVTFLFGACPDLTLPAMHKKII